MITQGCLVWQIIKAGLDQYTADDRLLGIARKHVAEERGGVSTNERPMTIDGSLTYSTALTIWTSVEFRSNNLFYLTNVQQNT